MSDHGSRPGERSAQGDGSDDYSWLFDDVEPSDKQLAGERDPSNARTQAVPVSGPSASPRAGSAGQPRPGEAADRTRVLPTVPRPGADGRGPASSGPGAPHAGSGGPPRSSDSAGAGPTRPRKRRRAPIGRIVVAVVVAWLVFLVVTPIWAWNSIDRVRAEQAGGASKGTTFLVVGSDQRSGMTKAERKEFGGGGGGQRTDTIMLLHVPNSGDPTLVSIPRDSYVPIPGHGSNKINAAFSFGGPTLLVKTIEQDTGLHIGGYVEVGFIGFVDVVNSVGGVHMCLTKAMQDADAHVDLKAGCQTLDGAQALGFVRDRHSLASGDLGRAENQRKLLAAITSKAASASTLLPWRYYGLMSAGSHSVTIGKQTSFGDMITFARGMRAVSSGKGTTTTVPIANANAFTAAGSSVLWDQDKAKKFFAELAAQ